jgi:predicted glutamine amidotransferase
MCELLGLTFNRPVTPDLSFRGLRHRGRPAAVDGNPDGWGIAWYGTAGLQVVKEPIAAVQSPMAAFVRDNPELRSPIILGHVRRASCGTPAYTNTHPFYRVLDGRQYVFAHNGTLPTTAGFGMGEYRPIGTTDSERAFCNILNRVLDREAMDWTGPNLVWLEGLFREINCDAANTFNCLLSDGVRLFVYRDRSGYNGLYCVERRAPFGRVRLKDEDWQVDLGAEKDQTVRGFVIASRPLTDETWRAMPKGRLAVFRDGRRVYPRARVK